MPTIPPRACCVVPDSGPAEAPGASPRSDRDGEFVESDHHSPGHWLLGCQLVLPSPHVLDEGMPSDDHPGAVVLLEPTHRPQPRLQPAMVALDAVVGVLLGSMPRRWEQLVQDGRVHRRLIGDDLSRRDLRRTDRPFEEAMGCVGVAPPGDEYVDDLPELVDGPVDVAPLPGHFDVGLVDLPAVTEGVPARPSGVGQQRCEPQHPPVDRNVVDLDPTLGE